MINNLGEDTRTEGEAAPEIETNGLSYSKEITITSKTKIGLAKGVEEIMRQEIVL